jgi:hypothetical protein
MGLAQYQILPQEDEWGVLHDGDVKNRYELFLPCDFRQRASVVHSNNAVAERLRRNQFELSRARQAALV